MRAFSAEVAELPSDNGRTTRELIHRMIAHATELCAARATFDADQFNNPDAADGYAPLAKELWEQVGGRVDAFVQSVGTAQCITGVTRVLRQRKAGVRMVADDPAESAVPPGGPSGAHQIEGVEGSCIIMLLATIGSHGEPSITTYVGWFHHRTSTIGWRESRPRGASIRVFTDRPIAQLQIVGRFWQFLAIVTL